MTMEADGSPATPPMPLTEARKTTARDSVTQPRPALRIRTGHSYHVYFTISLGQKNAHFVERALTPLNRYFAWADSISFTPEPGFDALHVWNAIPRLTRRPYVVTFEDYLPRMPADRRIPWLERRLLRDLMSARCRGIIATSDYALRQFRQQHEGFAGLPALLAKAERIYPAFAPRTDRPKQRSDGLKLLFVGRDFMRKGGPALLHAHRRLRAIGVPVQTTIVSSLAWSAGDYIGPPDAAYVRKALLGIDQPGITHHPGLASAAVGKLMDAADFLVLPTFHDTFGFVSIEAFASGTPVIATDTCVLPEIIEPGQNGHLLPFENDGEVGKWIWIYRQKEPGYLDAYEERSSILAEALFQHLANTWEDRQGYEQLSAGAVAAAHGRFHPDIARRRLETIYERLRGPP